MEADHAGWPESARTLSEGDRCFYRFPAYPGWMPGVVVRNGGGFYWHVRGDDGRESQGIYIEHVRAIRQGDDA